MRRLALLLAVFSLLLTGCFAKKPPPPQPVDVSVFLQMTATDQQKQSIEAAIRALPGVSDVRFETRDEAYTEFKKLFQDSPDLVNSVRPQDMPESFRFRLADWASVDKAKESISSLPGVDKVNSGLEPSPKV
ncbi:MAG TPA: hypothetical protein DGG94_19390 [Micromonosporaceae bacterium]|nr:hypothetical protein [Micromonosporaceae bacterium]HCU51933.1 hypothetical protein [Micromonosporaceae bacterium]